MQGLISWATAANLLRAASSDGSGLTIGLVVMLSVFVVFGGLLALALVCLARKEDRPDAIRAAAELLAVLLPWPSGRRRRGAARRGASSRRGGGRQPR
jgi:hypothetical protein